MEQSKHPIQRLMDNTWLLLFLGVAFAFASYTVWGWVELASVKPAALP